MKENRLLKSEILRKKIEFNQVLYSAKVLTGNTLILHYIKSPSRRIGFVVPKDVVHKAVIRNRIKRYLREIYRNNKEYFSETYSFILQTRENVANRNFHELKDEVLSSVKKIDDGKK